VTRAGGWLLLLAVAAAGCDDAAAPAAGGGLHVSILPQQWLAERLVGEDVEVSVVVPPGRSPATWDPPPQQLASLGGSGLWIRAGLPFEEALLEKIRRLFPGLQVVNAAEELPLRDIEAAAGAHAHGHDHGRRDPHFWLDPRLMVEHARSMARELQRLHPRQAEEIARRLEAVERDLDALDRELADRLAPLRGQPLYVFHPSWGYFTDRYGLEQVALEIGGKQPSPRQLAALVERARREGARIVVVQPQFASDAARTLAEALGAQLVVLDPLAADYPANLRAIARRIVAAHAAPDAS
jgi:zinc transport system substrate-binding protein